MYDVPNMYAVVCVVGAACMLLCAWSLIHGRAHAYLVHMMCAVADRRDVARVVLDSVSCRCEARVKTYMCV